MNVREGLSFTLAFSRQCREPESHCNDPLFGLLILIFFHVMIINYETMFPKSYDLSLINN